MDGFFNSIKFTSRDLFLQMLKHLPSSTENNGYNNKIIYSIPKALHNEGYYDSYVREPSISREQ